MGVIGLVLLVAALGLAQQPDAATLFREAVEQHQKGNYEAAIKDYEAFLKLRPGFVHGWSNLGAALAKLGRYDEAIEKYETALSLEPDNAAIRLNLALTYYKRADLKKASEELARVRAEQPGNRQALYLLADSNLRLGNNKEVIRLLEPLYKKNPDDQAVLYLLGTALVRDGQSEQGQEVIDRFMRYGSTAELNMLIGASQLAAGDEQAALLALKKATELNPKLPGVWSLYGQAEMDNDHPEKAKAAFRKELEADPIDFDANLRLGAMLRMEQKLDQATPYIETALRIRPDSLSARYQLGSIRMAQGKLAEACKLLETVVRDAPDFIEAHAQLASAYYRLGRKEDGRRERALVMKLTVKNRERERERERKKKQRQQ